MTENNSRIPQNFAMLSELSFRVPKKVMLSKICRDGYKYPICPVCGRLFDTEFQPFCSECGQALDWGDF